MSRIGNELLRLMMSKGADAGQAGASLYVQGQNAKALQSERETAALQQLLAGKKADATNNDAKLSNAMSSAAKFYGVDSTKPGWEQKVNDAARANGNSFKVGAEGFSIGKDLVDPATGGAATARAESNTQRLIKNIIGDFNTQVGKSPQQVRAAQAILEAVKRGDITTVGAVKAQLPLLEGENYRPTDAERKMMLSTTGEGRWADLKNFLGGDSASLSESQKTALNNYTQKRLADEQERISRVRSEVLKRWKPSNGLTPQDQEELSNTLGLSSEQLATQLQQAHAPQQTAPSPKTAAPVSVASPPSATVTPAALGSAPAPQAPGGMIKVKHKASGQTGSLPANEYDPSQYDKL